MANNNPIYFNFPIELLSGFLKNHITCLNDIFIYSVIKNAEKIAKKRGHQMDEEDYKASLKYFVASYSEEFEDAKEEFDDLVDDLKHENVVTGIEKSIYWDYYNNEKSEYQKVILLAHLAIKSVLHGKGCYKFTNLSLWSRMDGRPKAIPNSDFYKLSPHLQKYCNEYQTTKIKTDLELYWNLKHYGRHMRGFYVSYSMSKEQLIKHAETKRKSYQIAKLKKENKDILSKVLEEVKPPPPPKRPKRDPQTNQTEQPAKQQHELDLQSHHTERLYNDNFLKLKEELKEYGFNHELPLVEDFNYWPEQILKDYRSALRKRNDAREMKWQNEANKPEPDTIQPPFNPDEKIIF